MISSPSKLVESHGRFQNLWEILTRRNPSFTNSAEYEKHVALRVFVNFVKGTHHILDRSDNASINPEIVSAETVGIFLILTKSVLIYDKMTMKSNDTCVLPPEAVDLLNTLNALSDKSRKELLKHVAVE